MRSLTTWSNPWPASTGRSRSIIEHNPELKAECEVQQKSIYFENGSALTAISSDYQGASGIQPRLGSTRKSGR